MLNNYNDYGVLDSSVHDHRKGTRPEVPISEKYTLSIEEAAEYFRIGQKKLRQLIADDPSADYILMNGNRAQIKRKKFEDYIDLASVI